MSKSKVIESLKNNANSTLPMDVKLVGINKVKTVATKVTADDKSPVEMEITFDLSNLTVDDLINKAMRTIVIDEQRKLRQLGKSFMEANKTDYVVPVTPKSERTRMSSTEKVMKTFGKMTDEQKQELLDKLTETITK
tara:strand:- start:11025 stop:11435 length:411 start_codon:yes stop_codon:yes gene_type:complete